MRRLVRHAIAGVGAATFAVAAGVSVLGGQTDAQAILAAPAALASVPAPNDASFTPAASTAPDALGQTGDRGVAVDRASRDAARAKLVAAAGKAASVRAATLGTQRLAISQQQTKLKAAAVKAAAKAKAAEDARKAEIAAQGYEDGVTDPQVMAQQILKNKFSYGDSQFSCFSYIIKHESNWNIHATNSSSGAYGLPQALPGSKMSSVASDWRTNPATQIIWAVNYMDSRYGSPCGAQSYWLSHHNY